MSAALEMWRLVNGWQVSEALHVAAELGLSDELAGGPRTVDELAAETDCHAPSLYRLMHALSTVGVYDERAGRTFANTALGEALRTDVTESIAAWARHVGRPYTRAAWAGLAHGVRTGENAFRAVHGCSAWEYRQRNPDDGAAFDAAMTAMSGVEARWVADAYDFGAFATLVDVGGGRGRLLAELLQRYPEVRGVLFEQEHVLAGAPELLAASGVDARVQLVAGDFFAEVPAGGDAYLLKSVVHDWDDERAIQVLATCRRAMGADSTLLLVERLLAGPDDGFLAAFSDLNMMVMPGGRERTEAEYVTLLDRAGLRLTRVVPTAGAFALLEARPS